MRDNALLLQMPDYCPGERGCALLHVPKQHLLSFSFPQLTAKLWQTSGSLAPLLLVGAPNPVQHHSEDPRGHVKCGSWRRGGDVLMGLALYRVGLTGVQNLCPETKKTCKPV